MRTEFFTLLVNSSQVRLLITSYIFVEISICICLQHFLFIGRLSCLKKNSFKSSAYSLLLGSLFTLLRLACQ